MATGTGLPGLAPSGGPVLATPPPVSNADSLSSAAAWGRIAAAGEKIANAGLDTVERDTPMLNNILRGITIQSIRPVSGGGGGWNPQPPARDQVARGNFAEFHTQPSQGNYRVLACTRGSATANCAAQTADTWCRSIGWNGSAREHMETVSGREYLADVLCVRSGY